MDYLRNRPFLIVNVTQRLAPGTRELREYESVAIEDRVSNTKLNRATVIIDLLHQKLIKNRNSIPFSDQLSVVDSYVRRYEKEVKYAIAQWATRNPENLRTIKDQMLELESEIPILDAIRENVEEIVREYTFSKNDKSTRKTVATRIAAYLDIRVESGDLYDCSVKCDEDNNTTDRIDANELWIDITYREEEGTEYILIPVRVSLSNA